MKTQRKKFQRADILFALLLILLALFLCLRASQPMRWSDWDFGDAQTMLAVENWKHEGFLKTSFLWVPQGYSTVSELFDTKELNHHAHGVLASGSRLVYSRRMYTHYPSWYAVPYGLLGKMGVYGKTPYQYFAILLSLISVVLLFLFWRCVYNAEFALLVGIFYCLSYGFLGFCDSLATMPFEAVSGFSFIFALWLYHRDSSKSHLAYLYVSYLVNCLTSFDGILFLFTWAFLYSLWIERRLSIRLLLLLSTAPVLSFLIQWVQNISYLGFQEAVTDWFLTFWIHIKGEGRGEIYTVLDRGRHLITKTFYFQLHNILILSVVATYFSKKYLKDIGLFVWMSFLSGLVFVLVLSQKTVMIYEVRQWTLFLAIVYAAVTYGLFRTFRSFKGREIVSTKGIVALAGVVFVGASFVMTYVNHSKEAIDYPPRPRMDVKQIEFLETINQEVTGDKVVLLLGEHLPVWSKVWGIHFQVHPLVEYYAHAPVLHFPTLTLLKRDLGVMRQQSKEPFKIVVLYKNDQKINLNTSNVIHSDLGLSAVY